MVDRTSIERYRSVTTELSARVADELAAYFAALDLSRPEAVRNALLEFLPVLVAQYGQVAEVLAMDWYDELRAGAAGSFRVTAPAAASVTTDRIEKKVRYLAGQLWSPEPAAMLGALKVATDKYVKQHGRDTIVWNARREGALWARVPTGPKTCSWCLILASRDAVYLSEKSASHRADGSKYHGLCDCQAVPLRRGDEYPPGYLPDDFYDMYSVARDSAGSGDMKEIAAAFRREFPNRVTDGVHTH
ncbi:hypothetical protein ABC337_04990 [Arthrobacter sp. 1P04PC]|uniref:VG15 protein n=1 Tax=unclassified Arthrobacter TaxID=235627 RepID=UPI0039A21DEE